MPIMSRIQSRPQEESTLFDYREHHIDRRNHIDDDDHYYYYNDNGDEEEEEDEEPIITIELIRKLIRLADLPYTVVPNAIPVITSAREHIFPFMPSGLPSCITSLESKMETTTI